MGLVYVNVSLSNPAEPEVTEDVRVLVDNRTMLSVLPAEILERLGVKRSGQRKVRRAGGPVTRDVGHITMTYDGVKAAITVLFAAEGDQAVMGVTALGQLGYDVDPVSGELHKVEMLI